MEKENLYHLEDNPSFEELQCRLKALEEENKQQKRQLEVIMSSITGGLKISHDDDTYSFAYVSPEAAALFGYTVEEFMEVTGGKAIGAAYPPDLPKAMADCKEAFRDGNLTYSIRYRVRCKDGSLKWIIDSGKKAQDIDGNWMVNSLYLDITRSEEDEERLREQTQLLTSIYDSVPCGIIRFLRSKYNKYRLISLNQAALSLMGYDTMDEGVNDWHESGILGTILEEDRIRLQKAYLNLREVGDRQDIEYRVRKKDGLIYWMDSTSMIVGTTPDGETILQRTVIDITQRKALQQRLNREQEMYRVAMEASFAVMFEYLIDSDTFISYEPKPGQGVFRNELKNYSKLLYEQQIVHQDDVQMVIDNICNGRSEVFEVRCSTPEQGFGKFLWFRVNSRLMLEDGKPYRVVGALHNIHNMKSKLSENSERLYMNQSAFQAINGVYVSIFYVELQEDSYYAVRMPEPYNGMVLPRSGNYSSDLCHYILSDVDSADRVRLANICNKDWLMKELSGRNGHIEVEFRHKQTEVWLRMEIHQMAAEDGKTKTVILAFRDISEEKQRALEYYEEEKRAKQALEEAYASVNRANQAKSDFLSRMSHDIRTPMNAIMGMTEIAKNNLENREKLDDCLSKIILSGEHLLELINEVLDMSKIESGNISLCEDVFCLVDVLKSVTQILKPDIDRKSQQLFVHVEQMQHKTVCGDAIRVKQILINLLSNSIKYTREGGEISVCLEEKLLNEGAIGCFEFIIEDNGIGMSPEFLKKLFLPFERAHDSRVSQVQGTGLGLAITRNLIQMMNGTIQVESQLDQGSKFTVTIYLKLLQEDEVACEQQEEKGSETQVDITSGLRILLAEDNMLNQEIVQELLGLSGFQVVCTANGQEAVDRFLTDEPGTYALILMDIQMPVLDGYGAARAIRRLGETGQRPDAASIPIVALTADAFADDAYRAKQAGMNEHVAKPLEIHRLLEIMQRFLNEQ